MHFSKSFQKTCYFIPCYNELYILLYDTGKVMKPLTELFSATISELAFSDLLQKCEEIYEIVSFFIYPGTAS